MFLAQHCGSFGSNQNDKDILHEKENSLVRQLYELHLKKPTKGDWASTGAENLEEPILIIAGASGDESAAKYSEISAILGFLGHILPP